MPNRRTMYTDDNKSGPCPGTFARKVGEVMSSPSRRALVLVVDDTLIVREPIAACLRSAGYETLEASDGAEALRLIAARVPDVMILDVHMSGMDGLTLLARVRERPEMARVPAIMLTVETNRRFILRASELGAKQYLLKTRFSLSELLARVEKCLSPTEADAATPPERQADAKSAHSLDAKSIRSIASREQIVARAEKTLEGKMLSGAAAQVITMAAAPNSSMSEIGALIARDPILSANVLRVANSAAYASAKSVITTIPDAIRQVGCATVGRIAAAIAVIDAIPQGPAGGFNPIRAWQHSFAVARICHSLTPESDPIGGVAYLAGLCHDLADILFQTHFPEVCRQIADAEQRSGLPRGDVEQLMIGIRRADLMPIVLGKMGLPEAIRAPIIAFHNSISAGKVSTNPLARLLLFGEMYANGILLAQSPQSLVTPFTKAFCKEATGQTDPPCPDPKTLCAEVFTLTAMLARLSPAEDARVASPLLAKVSRKVWLARDRTLSAFDPLAEALQSLAEVQINDRLPTAAEAAEHDVIVVTTSNSVGCAGLTPAEISAAPPAKAGLPPLWLKPDADPSAAGRFPIALGDLHRFIESAKAKSPKAAA
jgi:HD-like signal output (HDOD) protein/FixJ family two-component response regulator